MDEVINLGDGVTLTKSTKADFDYINAHLREGDAAEQRVFGEGFQDSIELTERSWTIRDGAAVVGYLATVVMRGDTPLSPRRLLAEMTTNYVSSIKIKYVKFSRRVLKAVVEHSAPWITDFYTMPMASYVGAVKWDERILRMRKIGVVPINGIDHIIFHISRKEALV